MQIQHQLGADIIFAAAGASGMGVIEYVNETRCYRPVGGLRTIPTAILVRASAVTSESAEGGVSAEAAAPDTGEASA